MNAVSHLRREAAGARIVRTWLNLYTAGTAKEARDRRRGQVESDLWEEQAHAAASTTEKGVSLAVLGRMARGMPADIFWRLKLGGPPMEFNIRFEKLIGLSLLALAIFIPIVVSIGGYDPARDGWAGELTRLGEGRKWETSMAIVFQVLSGVGLVVAGAAIAAALRDRATVSGAIIGALLGASGLLVLATSALYTAVAELARDYVATGDTSTLTASRMLMLAVDALTGFAVICAGLAIGGLGVTLARQRIIRAWQGWFATVSVVSLVTAGVTGAFDGPAWGFLIAGVMTLLLWLLIVGLTMTFRKARTGPGGGAPAPA